MASIAFTVTVVVHAVCLSDLGNVTNLRQFLIVSCHTGIYSELACRVTMLYLPWLPWQLRQFLIVSSHTGIYGRLACIVTMPYLPWLPWQCDTIKTVSNFVMSPKVAMVS